MDIYARIFLNKTHLIIKFGICISDRYFTLEELKVRKIFPIIRSSLSLFARFPPTIKIIGYRWYTFFTRNELG